MLVYKVVQESPIPALCTAASDRGRASWFAVHLVDRLRRLGPRLEALESGTARLSLQLTVTSLLCLRCRVAGIAAKWQDAA